MDSGEGPGADVEDLIRRLRVHRPAPSPYDPSPAVAPAPAAAAGELFRPRRAAVLVCLFRGAAGELRVILTKRASSLSTHSGIFEGDVSMYATGSIRVCFSRRSAKLATGKEPSNLVASQRWSRTEWEFLIPGEVALPGGKAEEGDADDAATALRESKEEIGLDPSLVTAVASLEHFLSKHLLVVVPVVGVLSDIEAFKPVLNAAEVDDIFDVPLEMFLKDENRSSEEREWMGQEFILHHFHYEKGNRKYVIWGLTAGILIHTASVVYQRPPDFAERRVQFNLPKYSKECSSMP